MALYRVSMVKTQISSKGQTTIPYVFRKKWKTSQVLWEGNPDGSVVVRPIIDVMALYGIANNGGQRDPNERDQAHQAIAEEVAKRSPAR